MGDGRENGGILGLYMRDEGLGEHVAHSFSNDPGFSHIYSFTPGFILGLSYSGHVAYPPTQKKPKKYIK